MHHLRVVAALAAPLALVVLVAGGAQAQLDPNPDLAVVEVATNPSPATPGEDVEVLATVENQGDGTSGEFAYSFDLGGSALGDEQTHEDGLASGENATLNATTTWTVEAGEFTLGAEVAHNDTDALGSDDNADNDRAERSYTIGPDLRVTDFQADPTDPIAGETVEFSVDVENAAEPSAIASDVNDTVEVAIPIQGANDATVSLSGGIPAGESANGTATWTPASGGDYTVGATVDPDAAIPDQDRTNNEAESVTVEVRPALPDLVVSDVSHSPDPVEPDTQATFEATVSNNGHADAGGHDVSLLVGGEEVDVGSIDGVPEGGQATVNLSWQAEAGHHDVEVHVDASGDVEETSEENNAWTLTLPVGSDLVVREFAIQPREPSASDRVRFTVEIGNDGLDVEEGFQVAFDVDGENVDEVTVDGLGSDEVRNVTSRPWNATVGDHNVTVVIDPGNAIAEVDRTNNQRSRDVTIGEPEPDLRALSVVLDPATPGVGENATLRAQVENGGARDAGAFAIEAHVDGERAGQTRVDGLEAGATTTVDIGEWTASEGAHELELTVDAGDDVEESSEENNVRVRHFGIGTDLEIVELSVTPPDPEPGEEVTALVLAQNNGTVATPATNVSFRLDDEPIGNASLDPLEANQQASVELTFTATASAQVQARLDPDDEVDEFDEDNNVAASSVELSGSAAPPDLTIRNVTVEGEISSGEPVRFVAEVANVGEGPSPGTVVDFRVDGTSIGAPARVAGLPAGESVEVTSPEWTPGDGDHELEAVVDPENGVGESDETNNAFTQAVEDGPLGLPLGWTAGLAGLALAALGARGTRGSKRKPPKW